MASELLVGNSTRTRARGATEPHRLLQRRTPATAGTVAGGGIVNRKPWRCAAVLWLPLSRQRRNTL